MKLKNVVNLWMNKEHTLKFLGVIHSNISSEPIYVFGGYRELHYVGESLVVHLHSSSILNWEWTKLMSATSDWGTFPYVEGRTLSAQANQELGELVKSVSQDMSLLEILINLQGQLREE